MIKPHPNLSCLYPFTTVFNLVGCANLPELPQDGTSTPTPLPFSCSMSTEGHWRNLRFSVDSPEEYVETIEKVWGVEQWAVPVRAEGREAFGMIWSAASSTLDGVSYRVRLDRAGKLLRVAVSWSRKRAYPTLAKVIDCLGNPEFYIAALVEDRDDWLKFSLWYVEKGFVIHGSSSRLQNLGLLDWPKIKPGTMMRGGGYILQEGDFIVVAPGSLERMASAVHGHSLQDWELCLVRPWTGSIEEIKLLSFEEYLRCAT